MLDREQKRSVTHCFTGQIFISCSNLFSTGIPSKLTKMIPNGYLIFEDESFLDSTVAKMNALRKSGQFCDVRLQVHLKQTQGLSHMIHKPSSQSMTHKRCTIGDKMTNMFVDNTMHKILLQTGAEYVCLSESYAKPGN